MTGSGRERTAYLHVGTHKTGTTSIQAFLSMNAPALASAGVYYPKAGRPARRWGTENVGHHNVAWELNGLADFRPDEGTFDALAGEIQEAGFPTVVISSEDLSWLCDKPQTIAMVAAILRDAGYATTAIVYVRSQPAYIQAMYTENAKAGFLVNYRAVLDNILRDGAWTIEHPRVVCSVAYTRLADAFAGVLGAERTILRAYPPGRDPTALLREFLATIGAGGLRFESMLRPASLNQSPSLRAVLDGLYSTARTRVAGAPDPATLVATVLPAEDGALLDEKFDAMTQTELQRVVERFAADNEDLAARYGAGPPAPRKGATVPCFATSWEAVEKQRRVLDAALAAWRVVAGTK